VTIIYQEKLPKKLHRKWYAKLDLGLF